MILLLFYDACLLIGNYTSNRYTYMLHFHKIVKTISCKENSVRENLVSTEKIIPPNLVYILF